MDIPKGYVTNIRVAVPENVVGTINVEKNGVTIPPFTVQAEDNVLSIPIPYSAATEEGRVKVSVTFVTGGSSYTRVVNANVFTPYLELWQLKDILETDDEEECWNVEAAARNIIDTYTGQTFGYANKTVKIIGDAGTALSLPERLISLSQLSEGVTVRYDVNNTLHQNTFLGDKQFVITGSGWFLKKPAWASSTWGGNYSVSSDPIQAPRRGRGTYVNDIEYSLTGEFGWEEVPSGVVEAAKLLANDYACGEQIYRDRFLQGVKTAEWTLNYYSAAYYNTGNARANTLLSPYVVNRMKVI